MRIPTNEEYDRMLDTAGVDNWTTHCYGIYSWVNDKKKYSSSDKYRTIRGYVSARHCADCDTTRQSIYVGFRPAFKLLEVDTLAPKGELSIVGTLCMDGEPVEVPMDPKDTTGYVPGANLEIKPPLPHPGYIVTGYRVGDVVIADRVLLNRISYKDIEQALQGG